MSLFEIKSNSVNLEMHYSKPREKENRHIVVHFDNSKDLRDFSNLLGINITEQTKEVFYDSHSTKIDKLYDIEEKVVSVKQKEQEWEYWWGMPEYISYDKQGYHMVYVYFRDKESKANFIKLINQPITDTTNYIWFPAKDKLSRLAYTWVCEE